MADDADPIAIAPELASAADRAGLAPVRVDGCPPGLLDAVARAATRQHLDVGQGCTVEVGLAGAASFLRSVVEFGEQAAQLRVSAAPGDVRATPDEGWIDRVERLWVALNRGRTLLLRAETTPAPRRPTSSPPEDSPLWSTLLDRLPPLREELTAEIHRVPTYLVLADVGGLPPVDALMGLRRLLAHLRDARFFALFATADTSALLDAALGNDPRYLAAEPFPASIPFLVRTSVDLRLTAEVVGALVQRSRQRDVSAVHVLVPTVEGPQRHLSLHRTAALLRELADEGDPLTLPPRTLHDLSNGHGGELVGLEWVLPERVGLEVADESTVDVLGATAALPPRDVAVVARLQSELARERLARRRAETRLDVQMAARERAEAQLNRRIVRASLRIAERIGHVRTSLRR